MWEPGTGGERPDWDAVGTGVDTDLFDAAVTTEGPYAVGSGGRLVADRGYGWEVVFADGPATETRQYQAVDATDDGRRLWLAGTDGTLSCYDVAERRKFDYTSPDEQARLHAIAVSGDHSGEKLLVADESGRVRSLVVDEFDVTWGDPTHPSERSPVTALATTPDGVGFAITESGRTFRTRDGADWAPVGSLPSDATVTDSVAREDQRVYLTATDGRLYRFDAERRDWAPIGVTGGTPLRAVGCVHGDTARMVVLGADDTLYHRLGVERWEAVPAPTDADLQGLALGWPDVAVGAGGTVLVRARGGDDATATDGAETPADAESPHAAVLLLLAEQAGIDVDELLDAVRGTVPGAAGELPEVEAALEELAEVAGTDVDSVRAALEREVE